MSKLSPRAQIAAVLAMCDKEKFPHIMVFVFDSLGGCYSTGIMNTFADAKAWIHNRVESGISDEVYYIVDAKSQDNFTLYVSYCMNCHTPLATDGITINYHAKVACIHCMEAI